MTRYRYIIPIIALLIPTIVMAMRIGTKPAVVLIREADIIAIMEITKISIKTHTVMRKTCSRTISMRLSPFRIIKGRMDSSAQLRYSYTHSINDRSPCPRNFALSVPHAGRNTTLKKNDRIIATIIRDDFSRKTEYHITSTYDVSHLEKIKKVLGQE